MKTYGSPTDRSLAGLTRVAWVRVELTPDGPVCQAIGSGHRRPAVRCIPLSTATALMARGVPSVVRHPQVYRPIAART